MNRKIITAFCLSTFVNLQAQTLEIWDANSVINKIELSQMPVVKVFTDKLQISGKDIEFVYKSDQVRRFTFVDDHDDINNIIAKRADIQYERERIIICGVESIESVKLYTLSGIRIPVRVERDENNLTISLSTIPSGFFILNVADNSIKLIKK